MFLYSYFFPSLVSVDLLTLRNGRSRQNKAWSLLGDGLAVISDFEPNHHCSCSFAGGSKQPAALYGAGRKQLMLSSISYEFDLLALGSFFQFLENRFVFQFLRAVNVNATNNTLITRSTCDFVWRQQSCTLPHQKLGPLTPSIAQLMPWPPHPQLRPRNTCRTISVRHRL